jgi:hypothetical protein
MYCNNLQALKMDKIEQKNDKFLLPKGNNGVVRLYIWL